MPNKLSQLFEQVTTIARLPVARLQFQMVLNPEDIKRCYKHFTKPHPRYRVFQNKSLGAALVDLARFSTREEYFSSVKGRNCAEGHARKAKNKGYRVLEIDRNEFINDIHEINTSLEMRQGRPMDAIYRQKTTHFPVDKNFKYFGVVNAAGKLMAYGDLGRYGNFVSFNRVIGMKNNDGIMHLLVTEIICQLIESRSCRYLMYDTYFGASPGLKAFKKTLGFQPYRAKYSLQ